MNTPIINEGLCKQLLAAFYRRVKSGEKHGCVLRALLNEVYAHGVTVGKQQQQRAK